MTVVELLSPRNKRSGGDREPYLAKRYRILSSPTPLVEIDLTPRRPAAPGGRAAAVRLLRDRQPGRRTAAGRPLADHLRDPLPDSPVPLKPADPDAAVNLQSLLYRVYDAAGYVDSIYDGTLHPPPEPADAAWTRQLFPPG